MIVVFSFGFYVVGNSTSNLAVPAPVVATSTIKKSSKPVAIIPTTPVVSNPPYNSMMNNRGMMQRGIYNDGTYIGNIADAYYGNVQVQVTISNGRMTDVQFLDYPQDRSTSVRINLRAMPILRQEAIAMQSANVNGVSGASDTSPAFVESLTSALNQAKV